MPTYLDDYLAFLRSAGVEFSVSPELRREADHRGPLLLPSPNPRHLLLGPGLEVEELIDPERGLGADHASFSVAGALATLRPPVCGQWVVDLGCGTGVLGIVAARLGARVIASDIDPAALHLAERNARANGVVLELRLGSLCEPLEDLPVAVFLANLPHKPSCGTDCLPLSQNGGPDGASLFLAALPEMARRQRPGGRLLFSLHSLPDPALLRCAMDSYSLELVGWKLRWMAPGQYGPVRERFRERHRAGTSLLVAAGGDEAFITGMWVCRRRNEAGRA